MRCTWRMLPQILKYPVWINRPKHYSRWILSSVGVISALQIYSTHNASAGDFRDGERYITAKAAFVNVKIGNRYYYLLQHDMYLL